MPKISAPHLARRIRDEIIRDGNLRPGDKLPTIRSLGDKFDVTPSRILHAVIALEETGEVVRRHGSGCYVGEPRPNGNGAELNSLALLVPRHRRRSIVPALMEGVLSAAEDAGFTLMMRETGTDPDQEKTAIRRSIEEGCKALILYPQEHRPPQDDPLLADDLSVPLLLVGDLPGAPHLPRVAFDQEGCGRQMAETLHRDGRRRIAFWHVEDESHRRLAPAAEIRYRGLLRTDLLRHLPEWDITERSARPDQQPDEKVAAAMLDRWLETDPGERPDCLWALEDTRAALVLRLAARRGIDIPGDLLVCGADNLQGFHGMGERDFPTTKPDYAKLARSVVHLASDALRRDQVVPTRYLHDLPVAWPTAGVAV